MPKGIQLWRDTRILPANVVPVVIKSLLFPEPDLTAHPQIQGAA